MKKSILCVLFILASVFPAFSSGAKEEESFSYEGIRNIEIRGQFLNVEIRGSGGSAARMRSDLPQDFFFSGKGFQVKHEVTGSELRVWVERDSIFSGGNGTLFFDVPKEIDALVETASGDVRISGLSSRNLRVNTASGNITIREISGAVTVGSISGNLDARKLEGDLDLTTISGRIELKDLKGRLRVDSISGTIQGDHVLLKESSEFKTVSGDIDIDLDNALDELRYDLTTVSGRLRVGSIGATRGLEMGAGSLSLRGESVSGSQTYR